MCWQVYVLIKHINEFTYRLYSERIPPAPQQWSNPASFPLQGRCVISCSSTRTGSKHAACSSSLVRKGNNKDNNNNNNNILLDDTHVSRHNHHPTHSNVICEGFICEGECLKDLAKKRNVSVTFSFFFCFLFALQTGGEHLKIKETTVTTGNRKTLTTKPWERLTWEINRGRLRVGRRGLLSVCLSEC